MNVNPCYQKNLKLQHCYKDSGYLFVKHLHTFFERFNHNVNFVILKYLTKYYYPYQKHKKSTRRFFFTFNNDAEFNYHIIVDII